MYLEILNKGFMGSNSYIIGSNGEAAVIDAGNNADDIFEVAVNAGMRVKYIILTHGHLDHIVYLDELQGKTHASVAIHKTDAAALNDSKLNVSRLFGMNRVFRKADILLEDGDVIKVGDLNLEIIHTPGHTAGGICIKCGSVLFTGDTLFDGDFGRTDLPSGDMNTLKSSIKKIFQMNRETMIYPGHEVGDKLKNIILKCETGSLLSDEYWT